MAALRPALSHSCTPSRLNGRLPAQSALPQARIAARGCSTGGRRWRGRCRPPARSRRGSRGQMLRLIRVRERGAVGRVVIVCAHGLASQRLTCATHITEELSSALIVSAQHAGALVFTMRSCSSGNTGLGEHPGPCQRRHCAKHRQHGRRLLSSRSRLSSFTGRQYGGTAEGYLALHGACAERSRAQEAPPRRPDGRPLAHLGPTSTSGLGVQPS